jgi:cell division protein FtsB
MTVLLKLQELDDLVIQKTTPPLTAMLRNKIQLALEEAEADAAVAAESVQHNSTLTAENAKLKAENLALKDEFVALKAPKARNVKIIRA